MHHVDEFSKFGIKLLLAKVVLGNRGINILFEDMEVFRLRVPNEFDEFDQLLEVEKPDIVLILPHGLKNTANDLALLLLGVLKSVQNINQLDGRHLLRILKDSLRALIEKVVRVQAFVS